MLNLLSAIGEPQTGPKILDAIEQVPRKGRKSLLSIVCLLSCLSSPGHCWLPLLPEQIHSSSRNSLLEMLLGACHGDLVRCEQELPGADGSVLGAKQHKELG